jgi:hypothetical protein
MGMNYNDKTFIPPGPRGRVVESAYVLDRSNTGVVGSNPVRSMGPCPRFSLFCCPVQAEALRWADPLSKDYYQNVYMD